MGKLRLDPASLPTLSVDERARLDGLTDAEIAAAAEEDPENPPLTADELARLAPARLIRSVRQGLGLSQPQFARAFRFTVGKVRDLEQGRTRPDSATLAYLQVIRHDPETVKRALASAPGDAS